MLLRRGGNSHFLKSVASVQVNTSKSETRCGPKCRTPSVCSVGVKTAGGGRAGRAARAMEPRGHWLPAPWTALCRGAPSARARGLAPDLRRHRRAGC